jgi:hypothetical protein
MVDIKFYRSNIKGKKYKAVVNGKTVHFGALGYQHYHDRIGLFRHLDHNDPNRRKRYRERHSKIMKGTIPSYRVKYTPAWFSWHYLW